MIVDYLDPWPRTMLDIGVGPGTEAITLYNFEPPYDNTFEVYGLEPHPERFKQIKESGYPGTLLPFGVWSSLEIKTLYSQPANELAKPAPSVYCDEGSLYGRSDKVICFTLDWLDRYFNFTPPIRLWADIEGAELEMLWGAKDFLDKVTCINLEMRDTPRTEKSCTAEQLRVVLSYHGFKLVHEYNHSDDVFRDGIWVKK